MYLLGPFSFVEKDISTPDNSIIAGKTWIRLSDIYEARSIVPPTIGPDLEETVANNYSIQRQLQSATGIDTNPCISSLNFMKCVLKNIA